MLNSCYFDIRNRFGTQNDIPQILVAILFTCSISWINHVDKEKVHFVEKIESEKDPFTLHYFCIEFCVYIL